MVTGKRARYYPGICFKDQLIMSNISVAPIVIINVKARRLHKEAATIINQQTSQTLAD